jgi:hypothetical protein
MSTTEMDAQLAQALRAELAAIGTKHSRLQRHQRRGRALAVGLGVFVIAGAITGAAIVVNSVLRSTTVAPLGGITTDSHTGTGTLDLGPAPANAGAVIVDLTCLNQQGTLIVPTKPQAPGSPESFVTIYCSGRIDPVHIKDALLPKPGSTTITITADPQTRSKATAEYASSFTSAWAMNARGQTYRLCNHNGCPDLMAARIIDGQEAYISTKESTALIGSGYLNIYTSDGTTIVGQFPIGIPNDGHPIATPAPTT